MFKAKNPIKCKEGDFIEMLPYLHYPYKFCTVLPSFGGRFFQTIEHLCLLRVPLNSHLKIFKKKIFLIKSF